MRQGPFPHRRLCCPTGSRGTTAPSATLPTRRDFPFRRLYAPAAPDHRTIGVDEGFPSSRAHLLPIPLPLPRGFLSACNSRSSAPSMAFAVISAARHPLVPDGVSLTRLQDSRHAAGWTVAPPEGAFDTALRRRRFPPTPAACYRASWQLPGPDSHRLADTSLRVNHLNATTSKVITSRAHAAGHTKLKLGIGVDRDPTVVQLRITRRRAVLGRLENYPSLPKARGSTGRRQPGRGRRPPVAGIPIQLGRSTNIHSLSFVSPGRTVPAVSIIARPRVTSRSRRAPRTGP